jgi:hypothetical protein
VRGIDATVSAIKSVRDKKMGLLKASKMSNVPTATMKKTGVILVRTDSFLYASVQN